MKRTIIKGGKLACLLFLLNLGNGFAQVPGDGTNPNNNIPIDGGASLLAAAGVAYGVKKYRDYRKSSEDQENEI